MRDSYGGDLQLTMLLPDGKPDTAFAEAGTTRFPIPRLSATSRALDGMAIQVSDGGELLLVGTMQTEDGVPHAAFVRITKAGALDSAFGDGGERIWSDGYTNVSSFAEEHDANGALVGYFALVTTQSHDQVQSSQSLFHLDAAGTIDPSFGGKGSLALDTVPTLNSEGTGGYEMSLDAQGRILLVTSQSDETKHACQARRLSKTGETDASFGEAGAVNLTYEDHALRCFGLALKDGSTLAALSTVGAGAGHTRIVRVDAAGRIATTFAEQPFRDVDAEVDHLDELADGSLIVRQSQRFAERWSGSGVPDPSFGTKDLSGTWWRVLESGRVLVGYDDAPDTNGWVVGLAERVLPRRPVGDFLGTGPTNQPRSSVVPNPDRQPNPGRGEPTEDEPAEGAEPSGTKSAPGSASSPIKKKEKASDASCSFASGRGGGGGSAPFALALMLAGGLLRRRSRAAAR